MKRSKYINKIVLQLVKSGHTFIDINNNTITALTSSGQPCIFSIKKEIKKMKQNRILI
jgi:hypothetical protein